MPRVIRGYSRRTIASAAVVITLGTQLLPRAAPSKNVMPDSPIAALYKLTPQEAVDYLTGRGQLTPTFNWQDLWQQEHAQQFTISRLTNLDLMQALQDGITQNVKGDLSRRDWMKNAEQLLRDAGWWGKNEVVDETTGEVVTTTFTAARLKLIFDTNTRMAYSAGQWERIQRNKASHPYIVYITMHDEKVRLAHRAWDWLCLPVDDPFWDTHFPPNGWNCRCRVIAITQAEYDAEDFLGRQLNKEAPVINTLPWTNKATGETLQVPVGIDPGFAYNPGKAAARAASLAQVEAQKLAVVAPALVEQYKSTSVLAEEAQAFVAQALAERAAKQDALVLVTVSDALSAIADKIEGVKTAGKQMALDHDMVIHIHDNHGSNDELERGQLPVDALDFLLVADGLQNPVSVVAGDPFELRGVKRISASIVSGGYEYLVVFEVRRLYIVPVTMWKKLIR